MTGQPRFADAIPDETERDRLRATFAHHLAAARRAAGLSQQHLAGCIGAARKTIQRLECGERRPRRMLIRHIAATLDPENADTLAGRLMQAAGESLREDTQQCLRAGNVVSAEPGKPAIGYPRCLLADATNRARDRYHADA
jgi:transcriptional regulator with XRE-family HTH domain